MADLDIKRTEPLVDVVGFRLSWGAIWAGFVVATVVQMALSVLGMAIGLSAFDPGVDAPAGFGVGAAIWFIATAIVSLWLGGMVLGRLAGILKKRDGMLHGVVMWGLSTLLAVWMVVNGVGMLVGTTLNTLTRTTSAVVSGAVSATGSMGAAMANRPAGAAMVPERMQGAFDTAQARIQAQMNQLPPGDSMRAMAVNVAAATRTGAASVAWVALATMLLSLGAAVWGASMTSRS